MNPELTNSVSLVSQLACLCPPALGLSVSCHAAKHVRESWGFEFSSPCLQGTALPNGQ